MKEKDRCDYDQIGSHACECHGKHGSKPKYVRCPKCKRRLKERIYWHDDKRFFRIPPHKKKGWWKKPKMRKK